MELIEVLALVALAILVQVAVVFVMVVLGYLILDRRVLR